MQLVRFESNSGNETWGIRSDVGIHDIGGLLKTCPTMLDAIKQWDSIASQIGELTKETGAIEESQLKLLSPVPELGKTICIGLNYRDHAIETGADIPTEPVVFSKLQGTLCGPGDVIPLPKVSDQVDFEAELVMVIGKEAWNVKKDDADDYIFGYMCGHDVSARDWQKGRPGGQWLLGKSFPKFAPCGPYLVPRADIADPCDLRIQMRINGESFQDSNTQQLIFNPWELVAHLSQCCILKPGDLIFTGTPPGVGAARKPPRFLTEGDVCEVEIDGLGVLSNPVVAAQ